MKVTVERNVCGAGVCTIYGGNRSVLTQKLTKSIVTKFDQSCNASSLSALKYVQYYDRWKGWEMADQRAVITAKWFSTSIHV